jgi:hypothetical protein
MTSGRRRNFTSAMKTIAEAIEDARNPESIVTNCGYGFEASGLRPHPGMTRMRKRKAAAGAGDDLDTPICSEKG